VNKLPDGKIGTKLKSINAIKPYELAFSFLLILILFSQKKKKINNKYKIIPKIPVSDNSSKKVL
jgi:hypothetical protein